jgi:uncharacterized protein GlcG (DUF336 family)
MKYLPILALAAMAVSAANAQQVMYNGAPWPAAELTDPTRLPGDAKMPDRSYWLRPSRTTPGPIPVRVTTPRLDNALALSAAQAAIAACAKQGRPVAVAITDADGVMQFGMSAPEAGPPGRIFTAAHKAVAAIAFGKPTSVVRDEMRADPSRIVEVKPNMELLAGGLPIFAKGKMIGAIGVSGGPSLVDEVCAKAGLAKIAAKLK